MGKSAKFYKRPSKKEKEGIAVKKIVEPSTISKNKRNSKINVPASMFQDKQQPKKKPVVKEDIDMDEEKPTVVEEPKEEVPQGDLPDYVDLFSGKKTYKKIPKKRK